MRLVFAPRVRRGRSGVLAARYKSVEAVRAGLDEAVDARGADGELTAAEREKIHAIAARRDLPPDIVDESVDICEQERAARSRRLALTFPRCLPYELPGDGA